MRAKKLDHTLFDSPNDKFTLPGPVKPALHWQAKLAAPDDEFSGQSRQSLLALTASENFPAAQTLQESDPVVPLYLPASQLMHGPPSGPVKPGRHRQSCTVALQLKAPGMSQVSWFNVLKNEGNYTNISHTADLM